MAMPEVGVRFAAEFAAFKKDLESLPGLTDKEAQKMARAWVRRQNEMTREMSRAAKEAEAAAKAAAKAAAEEAKAAARAMEEAAQRPRKQWDATKKVLEGMGGPLGELAGRAQNLGEGLGSVAGRAGLAAAGIAGITFAVQRGLSAMWEFMDSAEQTVERLSEIEGIAPLPPATIASLREWEQASLGAEAATLRLRAVVAGELSPAMQDVAHVLTGASDALTSMVQHVDDVYDAMGRAKQEVRALRDRWLMWAGPLADNARRLNAGADAMWDWITAGGVARELWDHLVQRGEALTEGVEDTTKAMQEAAAEAEKIAVYGPVWDPQADAAHRAAKAAKALAEAQREAAAEARAQLSAEGLLYQLRADTLSAEQRAIDAAERRAAQLDELAAAGADAATIEQARLENTRQLTQDLAAIEQQRHEEARRQELETMALIEQLSQRRLELAAQEAAAEQAAQQTIRDANAQSALAILGQIDQVAGAYIGSREDMTDAERRAVMVAFRAQQAAGIAQAVIHGAMAFNQAMASLPPPASFVAAGVAAGAVAAQGIVIAAAKPPEFPTGGVITAASLGLSADHGLVGVQAGEGIVSRRGMAALGEQGLDALNRGEPPALPALEVIMMYRHRPMGRLMVDHVRRPGALTDALDRGRTIGHRER